MWIWFFGFLLIGIIAGNYLPIDVPVYYAKYMSVALLAVLDSIFGGIRATQEQVFKSSIFVSGFITNALLAAGLAYMGDQLGVALYFAAVFAFGVRIFDNLAIIRRKIIG